MRCLVPVLLSLSLGCSTTVMRLGGEVPTASGPAESPCEEEDWLVVAPTRAEIYDEVDDRRVRDDGVGLYRVGASRPESIASLHEELKPVPESFARRERIIDKHDQKRWLAAGLGVSGLVAMSVGAVVFASAFQSETVVDPITRSRDERQTNDGTRMVLGSLAIGLGFGLGITGLVINPGQGERSRADAARYVFLPPEEPQEGIVELTDTHNQRVRERCRARPE